jgi:chorismate-pyruvate lyase
LGDFLFLGLDEGNMERILMEDCRNPLLRVMLTTDGSMTLALEALLQSKISARVLFQETLPTSSFFDSSTTYREVVLESCGKQYLHAVSHIVNRFFSDQGFGSDTPIGLIMKKNKLSQYREIYKIEKIPLPSEIIEKCGVPSAEVYQRSYFVHTGSERVIHLVETFLPALLEAAGGV